MLPIHVAILSETNSVSISEVAKVAAAMDKQVIRDFGPLWGINATVTFAEKLEDVPLDVWPVIIRDDIDADGAAGYHEDENGQPFSLVQLDDGWEITVSHEVLEMLADPYGSRLVAGRSLKSTQGRVQYLVEVCDPSEAAEFGYSINGIPVSDFYTPNYFDPVESPSVRYSFTGAITKPLQVLKGGYISWYEPISDHWFQLTHFGAKPKIEDLGKLTGSGSLRSRIDRRSKSSIRPVSAKKKFTFSAQAAKTLKSTKAYGKQQLNQAASRAESLRGQIEKIVRQE